MVDWVPREGSRNVRAGCAGTGMSAVLSCLWEFLIKHTEVAVFYGGNRTEGIERPIVNRNSFRGI